MGHIVTQFFLSATDFLFYLIHGEHVTYCSINENWKKKKKQMQNLCCTLYLFVLSV